MKKVYVLLGLFLFMLSGGLRASVMTPNYYFNDFDGEAINDENSTLGGLNFTNAVQSESILAIDATNGKLYNGILTITFTSPLDLSDNALLTIEGKYDGLTLSTPLPEGKELIPQMYIKLIDKNNKATAGNNKVYEFGLPMKADTWTARTLDMKTYPNEVDFTQIAKVQIVFQAQSSYPSGATFTAGKFLFSKIEIGAAPTTSVLTDYSFENKFDGKNVSDANQTTSGQSGKISFIQQDNMLNVFAENGLGKWETYYQTALNHPIDLSDEARRKVELHFVLEGLAEEGKSTSWLRMRLYDVNGTNKIIEHKTLTEGEHELVLEFNDKVHTEGGNEFDYTQVSRFAITSNGTPVNPGHIYLKYLKIGDEETGTTTQTGALEAHISHFYMEGDKLYVSAGKFTGNETVDVYKVTGEKLTEATVADMPLVLGQGMYIVRISGENMTPVVEKVMQR